MVLDEGRVDATMPRSARLRQLAERRWSERDPAARTVADVRNDVQHAGFRAQPKPGTTLIELARQLSDSFSKDVDGEPNEPSLPAQTT